MIGPGKYDDLCTYVREKAGADGAMIIIFNGRKGMGFSAQLPLEETIMIPRLLRDVADQIEKDMEKG